MLNFSRLLALCLSLAASLLFLSCSSNKDPAIKLCKEFIKKAATGDKTIIDIIDFEAVANKLGTTEQEVIKDHGAEKWNKEKAEMVNDIITTFAPLRNNYAKAFKDFKVEEKGSDYWIVAYFNPAKEHKRMMVKKRNDKLKVYFYKR